MSGPAEEKYLKPYREAVERFGPGFEATLWGSEESQILRFEVMIEMIGVTALDGCRLLDIGCGKGDLARRLHEHEVAFAQYIGLDAMPEMIDEASRRNLPRCEFIIANVLSDMNIIRQYQPDFSFISGTLNTMDEPAAKRLVQFAFDSSAQGVVFNFLSDRFHPQWADQRLGPAHRFHTVQWLDWAMHLTPRISFTQDYLDGHDATILIRHA